MKEDTKKYIIGAFKAIPFGVGLGIIAGLLFGFMAGFVVCGISTLLICNHILSGIYIDLTSGVKAHNG